MTLNFKLRIHLFSMQDIDGYETTDRQEQEQEQEGIGSG
jgi:hypothetical protein